MWTNFWNPDFYRPRPLPNTNSFTIDARATATGNSRRSSKLHRIFRLQFGYSAVVPGKFC